VINPFRLTRPCANCPFRRDRPFHLSRRRAAEIADSLHNSEGFHCHKTTVLVPSEEDESLVAGPRSQLCAGALATMERDGQRTAIMHLGVRLGLYDPDLLDAENQPVYRGLDAWVASFPEER
jgi:hypothetical protein